LTIFERLVGGEAASLFSVIVSAEFCLILSKLATSFRQKSQANGEYEQGGDGAACRTKNEEGSWRWKGWGAE